MSDVKLTAKQKKFADYYVNLGDATKAAIKAGYSKKTARFIASENLTKPNIRQYVDQINAKLESERIADMREVKEFWTTMLRDKIQETKDRLKASEFIAKTNGAFQDGVNLTTVVENHVHHDLSKLTVEELTNLADIIAKATPESRGDPTGAS